tara:strand:- start:151 stop:609 length:459 start_codon:yes stop_codon:yes gene_type:complete
MGTITTAMCNSFKQELLGGVHDLDSDTLKIALIKPSPTGSFGAATTNFSDLGSTSDEATGSGYTSGGQNLGAPTDGTSSIINLSGTTAFIDFVDEVFSNVTVSAAGALIYNSSQSNKAIAVFSFGQTVTSTAGDFTIVFPTQDASNAVIRIT